MDITASAEKQTKQDEKKPGLHIGRRWKLQCSVHHLHTTRRQACFCVREKIPPSKSSECVPGGIPGSEKIPARLIRWYEKHGRDLPWRRTRDPYAIMVSEIMLQQTQVATVIPFFERWMKRFPDIVSLARAEESDVLSLWQGLGYYSRARNLHRASRHAMKIYKGKIPADPEAIRALPGVGRYTAGAIASFAFDLPEPLVDANVARVLSRLLDLETPVDSTAGIRTLWETATSLVPKKGARLFNNALMELGATLCTPRAPRCVDCPVRKNCLAYERGTVAERPVKKARRKTLELVESCGWVFEKGRLLLEQQTGKRWKGLWKLPLLRKTPVDTEPLLESSYPFTHHRVMLGVYVVSRAALSGSKLTWFSIPELKALPLTSPHRRAIERLLAENKRSV